MLQNRAFLPSSHAYNNNNIHLDAQSYEKNTTADFKVLHKFSYPRGLKAYKKEPKISGKTASASDLK